MKNLFRLLLILIPILLVFSCSKKTNTNHYSTGHFHDPYHLTKKGHRRLKATTTKQSVDIQPEKINLNDFGEDSIPFVLNCFRYNTRQPKGVSDTKKIVKCCNNEYVIFTLDEKLGTVDEWEEYFKKCK